MSREYFVGGGVSFPVDGAGVSDAELFSAVDPQTDLIIALFKSALNAELGGSTSTVTSTSWWAAARVGTTLATAMPVTDTLYQQPTKAFLGEARVRFPLLAVYRGAVEFEEHTFEEDNANWTWGVDYILGPLTPEDRRRIGAALTAAAKILQRVVRRRAHPSYAGGAVQFAGETNQEVLGEWALKSGSIGPASFADDGEGVEYLGLHVELLGVERSHERDDIDPAFEGATYELGVGGTAGVIPNLVGLRTELPYPPPGGG